MNTFRALPCRLPGIMAITTGRRRSVCRPAAGQAPRPCRGQPVPVQFKTKPRSLADVILGLVPRICVRLL